MASRNAVAKATLADLCHLITDGKHGDCQPHDDSGYYFLSCKDVRDGKLNYEGARQIAEIDFIETHKRTRLHPGDILITNSGTIGRMAVAQDVALTRRTTFQKSVAIVKPDNHKIDPKWLYYYLLAESNRMINVAGGTAQKNLLLRDMRNFEVEYPDRQIQECTTHILSLCDRLIDNNTRRIKILEEMTRHIYEEWFVRFWFPGHKDVGMTKSEIGAAPQGWPIVAITELCEFVKGIEPGRSAYTSFQAEDSVPFLRVGDLSKRSASLFIDRSLTKGNELKETDVAISLDGTVGVVRYGLCGAFSSGIRRINPTHSHAGRAFLYQYLRGKYAQSVIRAHANGATILHAGSSIRHLKVALPPNDVLKSFEDIAWPVMCLVIKLERKTSNIFAIRDLLLHKLIAGELEVSTLVRLEALTA